jgi:PadR family transcriptional regulator AphA
MSLKHAILGFLSFSPLTGYELKKAFDRSVQHFWPANQSQIYRTLSELSEAGWVDVEVIAREERLDMKRYHITSSGRQELHGWLSTPLPPHDYREPFLIQVYFAGKLNDEEVERLLAHELRALEETLAAMNAMLSMHRAQLEKHLDPRAYFLSVATLEFGIRSNQAALDWLRSVAERIRTKTYTL